MIKYKSLRYGLQFYGIRYDDYMKGFTIILIALLSLCFVASSNAQWNNPHQNTKSNTRYGAFISAPKTLDPARAYSSDEWAIIGNIYEPPLQYDFFKRPYALTPLTTTTMPSVTYYDADNHVLPSDTDPKKVAYSIYDIYLKPHIYYAPHPAFAKNKQGQYLYFNLTAAQLDDINRLADFKQSGTRELTAADYVYEIKRLADPALNSPVFGLMSQHLYGFSDYRAALRKVLAEQPTTPGVQPYIDLRQYPLSAAKVIDRYHYQIKIKGVYPQFIYWLSMPFFAPVPWEADRFYANPELQEKNITLSWYPVGTGPYQLTENNPNRQMVLTRNPNFHQEYYTGPGVDHGKPLPFVDKFIMSLDKEAIPRWNKFLQGYYDKSAISPDNFDQAIRMQNGKPLLTPALNQQGIHLDTEVSPSIFYIGFNMQDPVVGGYSEQQQKLRQAISIVLNYEDYIYLFLNGRGQVAHGPIPPGIFGYRPLPEGINQYVYTWEKDHAVRRSLAEAKKLLAEAGYKNGINPKTGRPLIINFDVASGSGPDDQTYFRWLRKEFAQLGIKLNIRATQYNRFQDKVRNGNAQLFAWGWHADYPDPENFLALLYGPNGKVKFGGENAVNYENAEFDALYKQVRTMPNGPERQAKIDRILQIVQQDSPWIWGFYPVQYTLSHAWNAKRPLHALSNNTLKYEKLDYQLRAQKLEEWNTPQLWPLWLLLIVIVGIVVLLIGLYWLRLQRPNVKRLK